MFQKLTAFTKKVADLADKPTLTPAELKAQFDAAPDEVREYLNNLIDALQKTTAGDSGAKNIGATAIAGLAGGDIQTLLENIATLYAKKQQENFIPAVLQNGWVNQNTFNTGYYKDETGKVNIRGVIKNGTMGTTAFALPVGYRPEYARVHFVLSNNGSTDVLGRVDISTNGNVVVQTIGGNSYLSLDNIPSFRAV